MASLRMLDYYKNLNSKKELKENEYNYITSITQSKIKEIVRTDISVEGKTFKRFVFSSSVDENNIFKSDILKYFSITRDSNLNLEVDSETYFLNNVILGQEFEGTTNNYAVTSANIEELIISNEAIDSNSILSLDGSNGNSYGFQSSISPSIEHKVNGSVHTSDFYLKSKANDKNINYISSIFESSPDSNFVYDLDLGISGPGENFNPIDLLKMTSGNIKNQVNYLDLTNADILIRSSVDSGEDILIQSKGIKITKTTNNDNSLLNIEKLLGLSITYDGLTKNAEIKDNNNRIIELNNGKYTFRSNIDEYNQSTNHFSFGLAGSEIEYSEYSNGQGLLFENKSGTKILISVDEIIEY